MIESLHTLMLPICLLMVLGCDVSPAPESDAGGDADTEIEADGDVELETDTWRVESPIAPTAPALPDEPARPRLRSWACPDRWIEVAHERIEDQDGSPFSWCKPPPIPRLRSGEYVTPLEEGESEGERQICDPSVDGSFPIVGYAECQPLGDPCPSGVWPEVPPEVLGERVYVLAGAEGGNGAEMSPFGSIGDAVDAAEPGDVIVIGAGIYPEHIIVDRDLTLWGRCVQDVVIESTMTFSYSRGAITVLDDVAVAIRNLGITGTLAGVVAEGEVALEGVWLHDSTGGVLCHGCEATLSQVLVNHTTSADNDHNGVSGSGLKAWDQRGDSNVAISSTTFESTESWSVDLDGENVTAVIQDFLTRNPPPDDLSPGDVYGLGISVINGAELDAHRVVVEDGAFAGLLVQWDARCVAEDISIGRTRYVSARLEGYGVVVCDGSEISAVRAHIHDTEGFGLYLGACQTTDASVSSLEDLVVRGSRVTDEGYFEGQGIGLAAHAGELSIRHALFDENTWASIYANGELTASIEDIWISNTRPSRGGNGWGFAVISTGESSNVSLARALVESSYHFGVVFENVEERGIIETFIEDLTVLDTLRNAANGSAGDGLWFNGLVHGTVHRALVSGHEDDGLSAYTATVDLQDITVIDAVDVEEESYTVAAIALFGGATGTLTRGRVERNHSAGIAVMGEDTSFELFDVTVRCTRPKNNGTGGSGILVHTGASATVRRAEVHENHEIGVGMFDPNTQVRLEDVSITDTLQTITDGSGVGLYAADGVTAELSKVIVYDSTASGIGVTGPDTALDIVDVEVSNASQGVILTDDASLSISRGRFHGNDVLGIAVHNASSVELDNVLIEDTLCSTDDGRWGRGLHVEDSDITVTNSQFRGNRDVSVAIFGEETIAALEHVLIENSLERTCIELDENDTNHCIAGRGYGLGAYDGATLSINDVMILDSAGVGFQLADGGTVTGDTLHIQGCEVAVNLQSLPNDFDWESAVSELNLVGNEADVDESEMSIPEMLPE